MLQELVDCFGLPGACMVLSVPRMTVNAWLDGRFRPAASAVRAVWLTWVLVLHPDRISSLADVVTWGRFRIERRSDARPEGWSGWSI